MQYFVEGVAESWVEAEWSCVAIWRWMELGGAGWSWVELDGAGWSWVHGLVIPNTNIQKERFREISKSALVHL